MRQEDRRKIYRKALSKYGINNQIFMVIEEFGELMNVLGKNNRGRLSSKKDIITEIADASIMVEQMAEYFGFDDYLKEKEFKLNRLINRINNDRT